MVDLEKEKKAKNAIGIRSPYWLENYDKPLALPRPAPKPAFKKKGRKTKEQDNEEEKTE